MAEFEQLCQLPAEVFTVFAAPLASPLVPLVFRLSTSAMVPTTLFNAILPTGL